MTQKDLLELIERIKKEPSVLFLGQNYLSSLSGRNCFYDAVNASLCSGRAPAVPSYQNLWQHINNEQPLTRDHYDQMYQVVRNLPLQSWLRNILSMRWGMVFTSAVDSCIAHCVGENFTFNAIGYDKNRFRREYMSKSTLHGVYLYGSVDGCNNEFPATDWTEVQKKRMKKHVNDRLRWIYDEILRDYGVLVIDGWDLEQDWLNFLLENAGEMPYQSIYLFGATPGMMEDETIQELKGDGILVDCPQTFAQALDELEFFHIEEDWGFGGVNEECKTVTIRNKKGHDIPLYIPLATLDSMDSRITLLDDDIGYGGQRLAKENRGEDFARYLQQSGTPIWNLCTKEAGFHFHRNIDDELWNAADRILRQSSTSRQRFIALEGVSNSGKTAALVNFGMRMRDEHWYPVIYISGNPTQVNFAENLKNFIKRHLLSQQDAGGAWVDRVIILWDGNLHFDAMYRYAKLARDLAECNVLVIGTVYRHDIDCNMAGYSGLISLKIPATLSEDDMAALQKLLDSIDPEMKERFTAAVGRASSPNLIYILQQIAKYRYSPEWKEVTQILFKRFQTEVTLNEDDLQERVRQFREKTYEEDVNEEIVSRGVGAAWQLALEEYLKELKTAERTNDEEGASPECKSPSEMVYLGEDLRQLNEALAVAGQFSMELPVTLLLNMFHRENGILDKENLFLNELLQKDVLVQYERDDQGYPYARFRHPSEAELYIKKNFGEDEDKRRAREVELLYKLIAACHWNEDESYDVIRLVRCFGPNSNGKYGQPNDKGRYKEYFQYLPQIADKLIHYAEDNPEAVLVYAHFLREAYSDDQWRGQSSSRDYLGEGRRMLRATISKSIYQSRQQYSRLVGELCSNLVASMPSQNTVPSVLRNTFRDFQNQFTEALRTWDSDNNGTFGTNSLLDIWLNAVSNFRNIFPSDEAATKDVEFAAALSNSLNYIDMLLELDMDFDSLNLLEKIDSVYKLTSAKSLESIRDKLVDQGNDTFLFLTARRCWLSGDTLKTDRSVRLEKLVRQDLFLLPDDGADCHKELKESLPELKTLAIQAAKRAVETLEADQALIDRSRSNRCVLMLIRAKWLIYSRNMPLEEKQLPTLNTEQWQEIGKLCQRYVDYCADKVEPLSPIALFLHAVYLWSNTSEIGQAMDIFRQQLRPLFGSEWYIERVGLCVPGEKRMRVFYVDVERIESGRYTAKIAEEITEKNSLIPKELHWSKINIPKNVQDYLFDGQMPCNRYRINKPVVIWFTANGPTLGLPPMDGKGDNVR